jgi:hypothetical protein
MASTRSGSTPRTRPPMPDLPLEIEPTVLAILEARMKEINAAAPAASERVKASAVDAGVVAAAWEKESRCSGSSGSGPADPSSSPPTRTPARPSSDSSRPASSPVTGAPLLGQAAYESELRGDKPCLRERTAA